MRKGVSVFVSPVYAMVLLFTDNKKPYASIYGVCSVFINFNLSFSPFNIYASGGTPVISKYVFIFIQLLKMFTLLMF